MNDILIRRTTAVLLLVLLSTGIIYAQQKNSCECYVNGLKSGGSILSRGAPDEKLSESDAIKAMECYLEQKGNKSPVWGTVLRNDVSQTFGPSPLEVVALFNISYLFYQNKDFASAMVLIYEDNDQKPNSEKAIKIAHKAYRECYKIVKSVGLDEVRKRNLDPLAGTDVSWY